MRILRYTAAQFVVLLFLTFQLTMGKKPNSYVIFTNVETNFNPDYIASYVVKIKPRIPGTLLDVDMHIIRNITKYPMVQINISKLDSNSIYRKILAFNVELCHIFGVLPKPKNFLELSAGNVLNVWFENVRKYGDTACPVNEGDFVTRNFRLDRKNIPSFILAAKYRIETIAYFNYTLPKVSFYNCTLFVDVRNK